MATAKRKSIKQPARPKATKKPVVVHKPQAAPLRKLVREVIKAAPSVPEATPPVFSEPLPIPEPPAKPEKPVKPAPDPVQPAPKPTVEQQVAELLNESWAHHVNRIACQKRQDQDGALRCAKKALEARQEAHKLDPKHTAPDWGAEQVKVRHRDTHDAMVEFYKAVLGV